MSENRVPPHDLDAEAAVLSAVLIDPAALDRILDLVRADHFYAEAHRRIYEAAFELHAAGKPVDVVQVGTWLKDRERISQVGGMAYLTEILNAAPAIANVRAYAQTIVDKWRVRQLVAVCQRIAAHGYLDYGATQDFLANAASEIHALAYEAGPEDRLVPLRVAMREGCAVTAAAANAGGVSGMPTGFDRYDRITGGLHETDLTIVAARPGMGKTSFILNVGINVAELSQRPPEAGRKAPMRRGVVVFSAEMPREQVAHRIAGSHARIDIAKLRTGGLQPNEWDRLTATATFTSGLPVWIDDSVPTVLEIRARVRRLQAEYDRAPVGTDPGQKLSLVIVDYVQILSSLSKSPSREQIVAEMSRQLKTMAKELKVAVVALSQLNRAVEQRADKRPGLGDLRESGAIEQDADNIVFVYRDEYYDAESPEKGIAELILGKQRNGPTGTAKVRFDKEFTRFEDLGDGWNEHDEGGYGHG